MSFKDISYLQLWLAFCLWELNHLDNVGGGHYKEYFCVIILNSDQWFKKRCCLKIFPIHSSGSQIVWQSG